MTDVDRTNTVFESAGVCPFLSCLKTQPHTHPVCPACGAVRYGSLACATCRAWHAANPDARMEVDE